MAKLKQQSKHKGHGLVSTVLYGPVHSRRYGSSLGINLLPCDQKICSFNCVYCQLGWNPSVQKAVAFPSAHDIIAELKNKLPHFLLDKTIDWIALSGNGEPTLHPQFSEIVSALLALKKKHHSHVRVVCFTNGTTMLDKKILTSLKKLDECCVKLDAGWKQANLPGVSYCPERLIPGLKKIKNLVIQSCFFEGSATNADTDSINVWISQFKHIKPCRVDIYTLSRRTPARGLQAISTKKLNSIASRLRRCLSAEVRVCL